MKFTHILTGCSSVLVTLKVKKLCFDEKKYRPFMSKTSFATDNITYTAYDQWNWNWDGKYDYNNNSAGTKHYLLVADADSSKACDNLARNCLSQIGVKRAEQCGDYVKRIINKENLKISKIIHSEDIFSSSTKDSVLSKVKDSLCDGSVNALLNKCIPYEFSPNNKDVFHILENNEEYIRNGKNLVSFARNEFYRSEAFCDGTAELRIIFAHKHVLAFLFCFLMQLPLESWNRFDMKPCSITWLKINKDGHVHCKCYGDTHYMDASLVEKDLS